MCIRDRPHTKEAAIAKLNASENARFVTNLALQIHGGYGYMKDYPLERMYRAVSYTHLLKIFRVPVAQHHNSHEKYGV